MGQAVKRVPSIVEAAGEAVLIRTLWGKEYCQYYPHQSSTPQGKSTGKENESTYRAPIAPLNATSSGTMAAAIPGPVAAPEKSLRYAFTPAYRLSYNPWREGEGNRPVFPF